MKYTLGFSPCPNDTFIFDALANKKIDTHGIDFDIVLEDVQTLNSWALQGKLDFSKISYGVLPLITNNYVLLNSGGALGKGVGPLLITKSMGNEQWTMDNKVIAIPGENTTAHLLFSLAYPNTKNKKFLIFNQIENAVLNKEVDCGVIIHENRFTYQNKGLHKIIDLGEYWEQTTKLPIPLGGIVAHKKINNVISKQVDALIKQSVEYAFANHRHQLTNYVKQHSQEMSEAVMQQHIDLYVNNYSINLGEEGKKAVLKLIEIFNKTNATANTESNCFLYNED
ncbi:MAG: 1,4-dihydroxy-6-naphthoate synthase [Bacteroidetes bacterium]|nr:1,4-dihydroxy-6-naphthoate synthase [Bacteroidota bacterium]MBS1670776.1 1,4-dihydroxy-6-naphthoate synthase [Bacteroidota bacterium]